MSQLDPNTMLPEEKKNSTGGFPVIKNKYLRSIARRNYMGYLDQDINTYSGTGFAGSMLPKDEDDRELLDQFITLETLQNPDAMEQMMGRNQSSWAQWGNAAVRAVGSEFIGGTIAGVGYITGNDALEEMGQGIQDSINEEFKIHSSYSNDDPFMDRIFNGSYLAQMAPSVVSTLSLMIPALGVTKGLSILGKVARYEQLLNKTARASAKLFTNANKLRKTVQAASSAEEAALITQRANKLIKTARGVENVGSFMAQGYISRLGESGMEGHQAEQQTYEDTMGRLYQKHSAEISAEMDAIRNKYMNNPVTTRDSEGNTIGMSIDYSGMEKEMAAAKSKWNSKFEPIAKEASLNANALAQEKNMNLMWQDMAQYALLGRVFGNTAKGIRGTYKLAKKGGYGWAPIVGKVGTAVAIDHALEGGEEFLQFNFAEDAMYEAQVQVGLRENEFHDPSTLSRYASRWEDPEAKGAAAFGVIGAGVFQSVGRVVRNKINGARGKRIEGSDYKSDIEKQYESIESWQNIITESAAAIATAEEKGDTHSVKKLRQEAIVNAAIKAKQSGTWDEFKYFLAASSSGKLDSGTMESLGLTEEDMPSYAKVAKEFSKLAKNVGKTWDTFLAASNHLGFAHLLTRSSLNIGMAKDAINEYEKLRKEIFKEVPNYDELTKEDVEIIQNRSDLDSIDAMKSMLEKNLSDAESKSDKAAIRKALKQLKRKANKLKKKLKDSVLSSGIDINSEEYNQYKDLSKKIQENEAIISMGQYNLDKYGSHRNRSKILKALKAKGDTEFAKAVKNISDESQIRMLRSSLMDSGTADDKNRLNILDKEVAKRAMEQKRKAHKFNVVDELLDDPIGRVLSSYANSSAAGEPVPLKVIESLSKALKKALGVSVQGMPNKSDINKLFAQTVRRLFGDNLAKRYNGNPHLLSDELNKFGADTFEHLVDILSSEYLSSEEASKNLDSYFSSTDNSSDVNTTAKPSRSAKFDASKFSKWWAKWWNTEKTKQPKESTKDTGNRKVKSAVSGVKKFYSTFKNYVSNLFGADKVTTTETPVEKISKEQREHEAASKKFGEALDAMRFFYSGNNAVKSKLEKAKKAFEKKKFTTAAKVIVEVFNNIPTSGNNHKFMVEEPLANAMAFLEPYGLKIFASPDDALADNADELFEITEVETEDLYKGESSTDIFDVALLDINNNKVIIKGTATSFTGTYEESPGSGKTDEDIDNDAEREKLFQFVSQPGISERDNLYIKEPFVGNDNKADRDFYNGGMITPVTKIHLEVDMEVLNNKYHKGIRNNETTFIPNFTIQMVVYDSNGKRNVIGALPPAKAKSLSNSLNRSAYERGMAIREYVYNTYVKNATGTSGFISTGIHTLLDNRRSGVININVNKSSRYSLSDYSFSNDVIFGYVADSPVAGLTPNIVYNNAANGLDIKEAFSYGTKVKKGDVFMLVPNPDGSYTPTLLFKKKLNSNSARFDEVKGLLTDQINSGVEVEDILNDIEAVTPLSTDKRNEARIMISAGNTDGLFKMIGGLNMGFNANTINTGGNIDVVQDDIFYSSVSPNMPTSRKIIVLNEFFDTLNGGPSFGVTEDGSTISEIDLDDNGVDDGSISDEDDDGDDGGLFGGSWKMVGEPLPEGYATVPEEELAWARRILGDAFPMEAVEVLINLDLNGGSEAYGVFRDHMIMYTRSAPAGTVRHEAFHAVFTLGLKESEREHILKQFTEEELATKFETYIDSEGKEYSGLTGRIRKFFRTLYQMLKMRVFSNVSVDDLFFRVHNGLYKKQTIAGTKKKVNYNPKYKLEGLTDIENSEATDLVTFAFIKYIDSRVTDARFNNLTRNQIINKIGVKDIFKHIARMLDKTATNIEKSGNPLMASKYRLVAKNLLYKQTADNRVTYMFTDFAINPLRKLGKIEGIELNANKVQVSDPTSSEEFEDSVEAMEDYDSNGSSIENWQMSASAISGKTKLSLKTRRALYSIPMGVYNNGKITSVLNSFGTPKMIDFHSAYNNLKVALDGIVDHKDLLAKLELFTRNHPEYLSLLAKLSEDQELLASFYLDFNKAYTQNVISIKEKGSNAYRLVSVNTRLKSGRLKQQFIDGYNLYGVNEEQFNTAYEKYKNERDNPQYIKEALLAAGLGYNNSYISSSIHPDLINEFAKLLDMVYNKNKLFTVADGGKSFAIIDNISNLISMYASETRESSFVNLEGKLEYSHNNPSYISEFFKMIHNEKSLQQWIDDTANDVFLKHSVWRAEIAKNKDSSFIRDLFFFKFGGTKTDSYYNDEAKTYENMSTIDYTLAGVNMYLNNIFDDKSAYGNAEAFLGGTALYRMPVLSNAPTMYGMSFKRYSNADILDNMFNVALQEYGRITFVNESDIDIPALNKNGDKFTMLPFLNDHMDLFDNISQNEKLIRGVIEQWLNTETEREIATMKTEGSYELLDGRTKYVLGRDKTLDDVLKNYIYNAVFANTQITSLMIGDLAFYKLKSDENGNLNDFTDVFKRSKEISSPGIPLNTEASFEGYTPPKTFNAVFAEDELASLSDKDAARIRKTLSEFGYTEKYIDNIINIFNVESTDGQSFISLDRYRDVMIQLDKWNPALEKSYRNLKNGDHSPIDVSNITMNPIKPFFFTHKRVTKEVNGEEVSLSVPMQIKNSELVILPEVFEKLKGTAIYDIYEQYIKGNKADVIHYNSTVKVGSYGTLQKNDNGEYTGEIHTLSNKDYKFQQESPIHTMDYKIIFGTQIRKLIIANLPNNASFNIEGTTYTKDELVEHYTNLITSNILDGAKSFDDLLSNKEKLSKYIVDKIIEDDMRSDLALITKEAEDGKFMFPLSTQFFFNSLQKIILSKGRKSTITQKIAGSPLIQFSSVIFNEKLNVVYNSDGSIKHFEAAMPYYTKSMFGIKEGEELPADMRELFGFRIPTEDKSSAVPIYVKEFLPYEMGGAIGLPHEIIGLTGSDFDVDKFYVMVPAIDVKSRENNYPKLIEAFRKRGVSTTKEEIGKLIEMQRAFKKAKPAHKDFNRYLRENGFEKGIAINETFKEISPVEMKDYKLEKVQYDSSMPEALNSKKARDNRLITIMRSIMQSKSVTDIVLSPSNFSSLQAVVDNINKLRGGAQGLSNAITPRVNAIMMDRNLTGTSLIGVGAVARVLMAIVEDYNVHTASPLTLFGKSKSDINKYTLIEDSADAVYKKLTNEDQVTDNQLYNSISDLMNTIRKGDLVMASDNELLSQIEAAYGSKFFYHTSRPLSELSAAFVDNAKYPLASFINVNMFTSNTFEFGLMLGFDMEDLAVMFSQNTIRDLSNMYFANEGRFAFDKEALNNEFNAKLHSSIPENLIEDAYDRAPKVTKSDYKKALNPEIFNTDPALYYAVQINAIDKFFSFNKFAEEFFVKSRNLRSDNAGKLKSLAAVDMFYTNYKKNSKPSSKRALVIGVDEVYKDNNLSNSFFTNGISKLRASLSKEFWELSNAFSTMRSRFEQATNSTLNEEDVNNLNEAYKAFAISGYLSKYMNVTQEDRLDLLSNFPNEFDSFVAANQELYANNLFLQSLNVDDSRQSEKAKESLSVPKIITYHNFSSVTGTEAMKLVNSYNDMLTSPNDATREFAEKLFLYSMITSNGMFTHKSFYHLTPIAYLSSITKGGKEFSKYLRELTDSFNYKMSVDSFDGKFIKKFLLHNHKNRKFVDSYTLSDIKSDIDLNSNYTVVDGTLVRFSLKSFDNVNSIELNNYETGPIVIKVDNKIYVKETTTSDVYTLTTPLGYGVNFNEYYVAGSLTSIFDINVDSTYSSPQIADTVSTIASEPILRTSKSTSQESDTTSSKVNKTQEIAPNKVIQESNDTVVPKYTVDRKLTNNKGDKIYASASADGTIKLNPIESVEAFWNYFEGSDETIASQQKGLVLFELATRGWPTSKIRDILNSKKRINTFLILHEESHILNDDKANYWKSGDNYLTQDKIEIEARATEDALNKLARIFNIDLTIAEDNTVNQQDKELTFGGERMDGRIEVYYPKDITVTDYSGYPSTVKSETLLGLADIDTKAQLNIAASNDIVFDNAYIDEYASEMAGNGYKTLSKDALYYMRRNMMELSSLIESYDIEAYGPFEDMAKTVLKNNEIVVDKNQTTLDFDTANSLEVDVYGYPSDNMLDNLGMTIEEWAMLSEEERLNVAKCNGFGGLVFKAKNGMQSGFKKGSKWKLVKDLKNAPTHAQGGVQLSVGENGGVRFAKGDSAVHAANGLIIPNNK